LFATAIGIVGVAWSDEGLSAIQLPEQDERTTQERLASRAGSSPADPPPWVRSAMKSIEAHLSGKRADFADVRLDLERLPPFHRRVYAALRQVEPGRTASYAELAKSAGSPKAARAVGQAMRKNPLPIVIPCHRVLASGGSGGFSAYGGVVTKARLLAIEGVALDAPRAAKPRAARSRAKSAKAQRPLPYDPRAAAEHLSAADKRLARLIERVGPLALQLSPFPSTFDALLRSIVYQQLTGKAAQTILERVKALFVPDGVPTPEALLALDPQRLRESGLSGAKTAAVRDLAQKCVDGVLPSLAQMKRLSDDEIVERLISVRGIGPWSVEMLLIFRLGRADVMPATDYGVRKGFALMMKREELPAPKELAAYAERWKPYRSAAAWYLWRANDVK
jgi:methylated-DNA-[protein]-cysteine S-methyltransferase